MDGLGEGIEFLFGLLIALALTGWLAAIALSALIIAGVL